MVDIFLTKTIQHYPECGKFFFNSKLSPLVKKYLDNDSKFVIKVDQHRLFNNAVILVDSFRIYWDPRKEVLGHPEAITSNEVNEILANPDENYAASPSLFQEKLNTRQPWQWRITRSIGKKDLKLFKKWIKSYTYAFF